jgi:hypothetical protein
MPDERHGTGGGPQEKGLLYWMVVLNPSTTGGSLLGLAEHESRALWRELRKSSRRHFFGTTEMKTQLDAILALLHGRGTPLKKTAVQNRIVAFLLELLTARERASAEQGSGRFAHVISHIETIDCASRRHEADGHPAIALEGVADDCGLGGMGRGGDDPRTVQ